MNNQPSNQSSFIGGAFVLYALSILVGTFVLMEYKIKPKSDPASEITKIPAEKNNTPNFSEITDVKQKKLNFFQHLLPGINKKNQEIIKERRALLNYQKKFSEKGSVSESVNNVIEKLEQKYKTTDPQELLLRIDQIPASLALAQAATESGWGSSRFAREGNNFFGQWCYREGCGLVPLNRNHGATHEVKVFDSIDDSISAYFDNLNTNQAYTELRQIRSDLRANHQNITGKVLAQGLEKYSEKGYEYVDMIQAMIASNKLDIYDVQLVSNNDPKTETQKQ